MSLEKRIRTEFGKQQLGSSYNNQGLAIKQKMVEKNMERIWKNYMFLLPGSEFELNIFPDVSWGFMGPMPGMGFRPWIGFVGNI